MSPIPSPPKYRLSTQSQGRKQKISRGIFYKPSGLKLPNVMGEKKKNVRTLHKIKEQSRNMATLTDSWILKVNSNQGHLWTIEEI